MFFVVNKEKLISYLIAFSTVGILFFIGGIQENKNTMETSYMQKQNNTHNEVTTENNINVNVD